MTKPAIKPISPAPVKKTIVSSGTIYIVEKGDTLYSIAFLQGVDFREIVELNNIENPSAIQIGQQLNIPVPKVIKVAEKRATPLPVVIPLGAVKSQPKAGKLPYSEGALTQAERIQEEPQGASVKAEIPSVKAEVVPAKEADEEDDLEWGMPSIGKVIVEFSESANRKGVDMSGKQGQAVVASATGKVVYSGSGLRGYGKLVIIKHNKTFLSAYAHNDQVLVKEGQSVTKGQKIAEMGNTDSDQVKLHFEIRKFGKPVDPALFLPLIKS